MKLGYINLYKHTGGYLHWAGEIFKTKKETLENKENKVTHTLGVVFLEKDK